MLSKWRWGNNPNIYALFVYFFNFFYLTVTMSMMSFDLYLSPIECPTLLYYIIAVYRWLSLLLVSFVVFYCALVRMPNRSTVFFFYSAISKLKTIPTTSKTHLSRKSISSNIPCIGAPAHAFDIKHATVGDNIEKVPTII